jgi:hypothetical protein
MSSSKMLPAFQRAMSVSFLESGSGRTDKERGFFLG